MNLNLENKLQAIYNEKKSKLIPENIKAGQMIMGVLGNFTYDSNANSSQILSGYSAYVNGQKVIGSITNRGSIIINPSTSSQSLTAGYITGGTVNPVTAAIDSNISDVNIKVGVNILNISGTFTSDATASADYIANGYTAYVGGNKLTGVANIIKTYNSLNEMYNDNTAIANYSYGLETRNDVSYSEITYNIHEGSRCLNILNSFINTASKNLSLMICDTSFDYDFDFYNSGISINSTNAYITIMGENNECLLDAQYTSLDGVTYNLSSISGTCLEDNNTKFYCNLANILTMTFKGDVVPTYYNDFDCFWKPLSRVDNGSYVAALYKYDGINWNKLIDADEPISSSNFNIAYNTVNQIKGY